MRGSVASAVNGRRNSERLRQIHSEPNSASTSSSPTPATTPGSVSTAVKALRYRQAGNAMSFDYQPNVSTVPEDGRASETLPPHMRRRSPSNGSTTSSVASTTASSSNDATSINSNYSRFKGHPLTKAPTLPCTSSEEGPDSPLFLRTISMHSLPPTATPTSTSLYEKTLQMLATDVNYQKEVALGKRIGFYRLGKELGCGNFSKVKLGVHVLTKEKVAIKLMEKSKMDQKAQRLLTREIDNMEQMHHPNIIRLFECVETLSKLYLVMEYAGGGELYTFVHDNGKLSEDIAKPIFAQIVSAVAHMHSKGIVHRDLKAENVIFAQPGWVKLADFGFSCKYEDERMLNTFCGSPPYSAPELFRDQHYNGPMVDIWAMGVLLYFMLVGVTPFRGETVHDLKKNVLDGQYHMPEYVSTFAQHMIHRMLEMDPVKRMTVNELKRTYWLRESKFPESYMQISLNPDEKELEKNDVEKQVWNTLHDYGIDKEMIRSSVGKGARNAIIGTYRIVLYQCQAKDLDLERLKIHDHLIQLAERDRRINQRMNQRSKTCAIL